MDDIQTAAAARAHANMASQIVDVRIKHADLPDGSPLDSALQADADRAPAAGGDDPRAGPEGGADRPRRGRRDAARIYAESFSKDADFYDFYRAMQSYRHTFGADGDRGPSGRPRSSCRPNNSYLREFEGRGR